MQCNNTDLLSDGSKFSAAPSVQEIYKLALLCAIATALNPSMNCSPATLLANGAGFACLSPELQRVVELQLLCEISGSAAGFVPRVTCGTTTPTEAPAGGCGLFVNTVTEELLFWNGTEWRLKT